MESIFLLPYIFVIFSLAVNASHNCRVRYCNNKPSAFDIYCSCDSSCWRRQNCCLNYLNQTNVDNETYYFGIPKEHIEQGQFYRCHAINQYETHGHSVISKCADPVKHVTDSWLWQKSLCEQPVQYEIADDMLLKIPVSSNSTGETYKNIYCAACRNNLEDITFWNTRAVCPKASQVSNLTEALQNLYVNASSRPPICRLEVAPPPNVKTFPCSLPYIGFTSTCPPAFINMSTSSEDADKRREIEWLCRVTSNKVNINGTYYDNLYCAACHFNETDVGALANSKHGACSRQYVPLPPPPPPAPAEKSFTVLLDFDSSSTKGNTVGVSNRCPSGTFYDVFTAKCRLLICSNGYHYYNGQCQRQTLTTLEGGNVGSTQLYPYERLEENQTSVIMSSCHKMQVERSEVIVNENGTLTLDQHRLYPIGTFEIVDNDSVHVCVDLNDNYVFDFRDDTHTYLTIVCSSLSLTALLLKIIIFSLISDVRKFPDKLVFCLCVSLFIAQLLFLLPMSPTTNYITCASVGVVTHYFFLSSFCWMNVLAYDIWNTLSQCIESRFIHTDILKRRFHCYSLYAWVTPMLIVSAACVFDWSGIVDESSVMRPHYGDNLCWINARTALLFYFAIPIALLLLLNVAFFVLTAVSICRSSRAFPNVQSPENFQNCCHKQSPHHVRFSVYVKLCVIMGLTWISGFVAAFSGQQWLWYVFTVISGSQGVYILIALTPFKTVLQILKHRFHSHGNNNFNLHALNLNVGNGSTQNEIVVSNIETIMT